jgi:hypothetical protein
MKQKLIVAAVAVLVLGLSPVVWAGDEEPSTKKDWSIEPTVGVTNYFLYNSNPFFGSPSRYWLETSAYFGGTGTYKDFSVRAVGMAAKTTGQDPYGSGTVATGAPAGTPASSATADFDIDEAYIRYANIGGLPLQATLGRQHIKIGDQFLFGDGVYDGFAASNQQAVYHSPRLGFDAFRLEWDIKKIHFDSFVYWVDPTWDGGGGRDGILGGLDVSRTFDEIKGTYGAGIFYRYSRSNADNDMTIASFRLNQQLGVDGLRLSGEVAGEFGGKCNNATYCTTVGQSMKEYAWHAELAYQANHVKLMPFVEAGYVYYSNDFTPFATGWSDWGKWYLGNQIDWIVFSNNSKIIRGELGFWPHASVKTRLQYHNTRQVTNTGTSTGGSLSDEFSFITEWYPNDWFWANLLVGYNKAGSALGLSGVANAFAFINSGATAVGTSDSVDVVVATGVRF